MEPFVVDALQVARLFQASVLVVNSVDEIQLISYDVQLTCRNVLHLVKYEAVNAQFLDFLLQRNLSPDIVVVLSISDTGKTLLRR